MTKSKNGIRMYVVAGVAVLAIGVFVGWILWTRHEFELAGDHWLSKAFDDARDWSADAELVAIEGHYVRPDGVAELQDSGLGWQFMFHSPARAAEAARPAPSHNDDIPGAPAPPRTLVSACFGYTVDRGSGKQRNLVRNSGGETRCRKHRGPGSRTPPRCSIVQVWQRAIQQGAPDPGYATIEGKLVDGRWQWQFRIAGHVDLVIADDC